MGNFVTAWRQPLQSAAELTYNFSLRPPLP